MRYDKEIQCGFHFAEPELCEEEIVIAAAVRYSRDGFVFQGRPGQIHCGIGLGPNKYRSIWEEDNAEEDNAVEDGYVTNHARFVGRSEAAIIATQTGRNAKMRDELESVEYLMEAGYLMCVS